MSALKAPWTPEQVVNANAWQQCEHFHPYTCGDCRADLLATEDGWVCSTGDCGYTQDWAHETRLNESPEPVNALFAEYQEESVDEPS